MIRHKAATLGVLAVDSGTLIPSKAWRATEPADAPGGFRDAREVAALRERLVDPPVTTIAVTGRRSLL